MNRPQSEISLLRLNFFDTPKRKNNHNLGSLVPQNRNCEVHLRFFDPRVGMLVPRVSFFVPLNRNFLPLLGNFVPLLGFLASRVSFFISLDRYSGLISSFSIPQVGNFVPQLEFHPKSQYPLPFHFRTDNTSPDSYLPDNKKGSHLIPEK